MFVTTNQQQHHHHHQYHQFHHNDHRCRFTLVCTGVSPLLTSDTWPSTTMTGDYHDLASLVMMINYHQCRQFNCSKVRNMVYNLKVKVYPAAWVETTASAWQSWMTTCTRSTSPRKVLDANFFVTNLIFSWMIKVRHDISTTGKSLDAEVFDTNLVRISSHLLYMLLSPAVVANAR